MNNTPFFSVIIPIYNMADYLPECIESVQMQTCNDWELILIDDGSTDKSLQICKYYACIDKRIKVLHKENGGEFSARLAGIQIAEGKYVTGLDPDDYYDRDYLQIIKNELEKNKVDCLMWSFTLCGEKTGVIPLREEIIKQYSGEEYLLMVVQTTLHSFCSKAIRLDIFRKTDFSKIPDVRMSEDYIMVIPALCNVRSAKVIDYYGYNYRIRSNSTSNTVDYKKLYDMCEVSKYGLEILKKNNYYDERYIEGEANAFLRSIVPRIWKGINEKTISTEEVLQILNSEVFIDSIRRIGDESKSKLKLDTLMKEYKGAV